jgi:hypothetical protein
MAMAPHPLDDVFRNPASAENDVLIKKAFADARLAFSEAEKTIKSVPGVIGLVPCQQARRAFLEAIHAQESQD